MDPRWGARHSSWWGLGLVGVLLFQAVHQSANKRTGVVLGRSCMASAIVHIHCSMAGGIAALATGLNKAQVFYL